ncbi:pteridine reductase [Xanthomonas campestris pv. campestris]|uniref:pteridine reductase n=1 Tax=Xanthomonas campestris TaxID=339 RepID=UPI0023688813|nr:pteridine reductase [Xanthomonas campestris]MEA0761169.1 pteridine reductase [Xanthomonas campestris pv. campestris]MEB1222934.1 pteridine reductase [Xanthomonas campestris pv. campestris]MEB1243512.1 pteridine reductase [Xanthomonas campestris pv. campestris]MEB1252003.1 pteridine reductase [Xanthomonas campestris pv. campestris]MEB1293397.1 pteridine reductase [Xanthomonas campestris pv. campestris]
MTDSSKVVLITGAARRIGAQIATTLHASGYRVALHAHRSGDALAARVAALCAQRAGSACALQADLRTPEAPAQLVDACVAAFGRLDAVVNNASAFYPTVLGEATPAQWDELFAVNARAPFFIAQAAAAQLRAHHGAIVNLTDLHAEQPMRQHPLYGASKSALEMLTRSLALELAPQVRVNAVAPGAILWPEDGKADAAKQALLARTPLARIGTPEEVAEAVRWLLDDASFITGHTLRVDGGRRLS